MPAQKYFFDEHKDHLIREAYQSPNRNRRGGTVSILAKRIGIPRCIILQRARKLGLNPPVLRNTPWSKEEDEILENNAWRCPEVIARHLKKAGFSRSANAIEQRLEKTFGITRREALQDAGFYTLSNISKLLGCDHRLLNRAIKEKKLNATMEGTRSDGRAAQWLVKEKDLRKFVINYTAHLNFARIDKFWLVDLLTGSSKPKQDCDE